MKKHLLTFLAAGVMSAAWAQAFLPAPEVTAPAEAPRHASGSYDLRFCSTEVLGWQGWEGTDSLAVYIAVDAQTATQLAGNAITAMHMSVVVDGSQSPASTVKGKIFVSESPDLTPVAEMNMSYRNAYYASGYKQTGAFSKSREYVIKENTPFWFGFTVGCDGHQVMLGMDTAPVTYEDTAKIRLLNGGVFQDEYPANEVMEGQDGSMHNLFFYATTEGDAGVTDVDFGEFYISHWPNPTFDKEHMMPVKVPVHNRGTEAITSIGYSYWFASNPEMRNATVETDIAAGAEEILQLPIDYPVERGEVSVRIESINGQDTGIIGRSKFFYTGDIGYPARFVMEEGTGTWCGFCPRGTVTMHTLQSEYPDEFIGIALHFNDDMATFSYMPIIQQIDAFPKCIINRIGAPIGVEWETDIKPLFENFRGQRSNGLVELTCEMGSTIKISSRTTFAADDDHTYRIAYVLCEDGIFDYQANNYAGSGMDVGGFENLPSWAPWYYAHVARDIKDAYGLSESTVNMPRAGQTYECSVEFDLSRVSKPENSYVWGMLIDANDGMIITGGITPLVENGHLPWMLDDGVCPNFSSIESITADVMQTEAEFYTIAGQRVREPQRGGIYIVRIGEKAEKIIY